MLGVHDRQGGVEKVEFISNYGGPFNLQAMGIKRIPERVYNARLLVSSLKTTTAAHTDMHGTDSMIGGHFVDKAVIFRVKHKNAVLLHSWSYCALFRK